MIETTASLTIALHDSFMSLHKSARLLATNTTSQTDPLKELQSPQMTYCLCH